MTWAATGEPRGPLEIGITIGVVTLVIGVALALVLGSRPTRQPVAFVGDSITLLSAGQLRARLGDDYALKIDATSGRRVDEQMGAAAAAVARDNNQVLINLGTNDVMQGDVDIAASAQHLEQMVAMFPDATCIHLVTVSDQVRNTGVAPDAVAGRAAVINDAIRAMAAQDPRVTVIDWDQRVRDYMQANGGATPTEDSIHPDDAGREILVDGYEAALEDCAV